MSQRKMSPERWTCIGAEFGCPCLTRSGSIMSFMSKGAYDKHSSDYHWNLVFDPMAEVKLPSRGWIIIPDSIDEDLWLLRRLRNTDDDRVGEVVAQYVNYPQAMDVIVGRDQTRFETPVARRVSDLDSNGELDDTKEEESSKSADEK